MVDYKALLNVQRIRALATTKSLLLTAIAFALGLYGSDLEAKPKKPITFGEKPTKEYAYTTIQQYLNSALIDPYSAHTKCSEVSERAWVWPGIGFGKRYGFLVFCDVNAKNQFGGYTGSKRYVFRFNGAEFAHEDIVPRMGLYTDE